MCGDGAAGRWREKFELKLDVCWKGKEPTKSAVHASLRSGDVVLFAAGRAATTAAEDPPDEEHWWHVSNLALSPWCISAQELVWDGIVHRNSRRELEATGTWLRSMEIAAACGDLSLTWTVQFFTLDASPRPLPEFNVGLVSVYPLDFEGEVVSRPPPPRRPRGPRRGGGPRMLEDAPDPDVLPDPDADADFLGADGRGDDAEGDGEDDHIGDEPGDDEPGEEEVFRGRTP